MSGVPQRFQCNPLVPQPKLWAETIVNVTMFAINKLRIVKNRNSPMPNFLFNMFSPFRLWNPILLKQRLHNQFWYCKCAFVNNHLLSPYGKAYGVIMTYSLFHFKYGNPYLFPPTNESPTTDPSDKCRRQYDEWIWGHNRYGWTGHARTKRGTVIVSGSVCKVGKVTIF